MKQICYQGDLCVVGGGMAGVCAAIAAARHGVKTILVHDRPVLGGNASSEIRVPIYGAEAQFPQFCQTGIMEEIRLQNLAVNTEKSWAIWDHILYGKVKYQNNLMVVMNCSIMSLRMDGRAIDCIEGWQMTSETKIKIKAKYFADCSGDGILAPLSGAHYRIGREAKSDFKESFAQKRPDAKTMGMSCLFEVVDAGHPVEFTPPEWAYDFPTDKAVNRGQCNFREHIKGPYRRLNGYGWVELGGEQDSIHDTEKIKDELLKIAYGLWDHIKNHGDHGAENWSLEWMGFLPGKRESRRYIGDYVLTQNDVESGGHFADSVAYGGWSMDEHHPAGFYHKGPPWVFHEVKQIYGIPYRSLYSRNVKNLFFAGRNISATHMALCSTRVMGTCALMGEAVGIASALCKFKQLKPKELYPSYIKDLQQKILEGDGFLPGVKRQYSRMTHEASYASSNKSDPESLRDGWNRSINGNRHAWEAKSGDYVEVSWPQETKIKSMEIICDSDFTARRQYNTFHYAVFAPEKRNSLPGTLLKDFKVEAFQCGRWRVVLKERRNYKRQILVPLNCCATKVRFTLEASWGKKKIKIFTLVFK